MLVTWNPSFFVSASYDIINVRRKQHFNIKIQASVE